MTKWGGRAEKSTDLKRIRYIFLSNNRQKKKEKRKKKNGEDNNTEKTKKNKKKKKKKPRNKKFPFWKSYQGQAGKKVKAHPSF